MLSDDDRDHADLLFIRTRSGNPEQQRQAWQSLQEWAVTRERRDYLSRLARTDAAMAQLIVRPEPQRLDGPARRSRWRGWQPLASAAVLLLLLGGTWWFNPTLSREHHQVAIGEQQELALADGSRVVLNTGSELMFSNRLRSRDARLLHGEALFDVEHGVLRPFQVQSGDSRVRVVGTLFSVRRLESGTRVAVANGRVEVLPQGERDAVLLEAGQQVETADGHFLGDIGLVDSAMVGSWSQGRLVFDRVPLKDALAELQRYRKAPIRLLDESLGKQTLTGSFSSSEPDRILELLPNIFSLRVSIAEDGTAYIRRR